MLLQALDESGQHFAVAPLEALGMTANFDPGVAGKVFLVAAPFVLLGAALMTVVASFTRTYREAQSYLTVVLLVPTLPILFAGLYSLRPGTWLMAIPSLSQHLLITNLLYLTPGEAVINEKGLTPDVAIEQADVEFGQQQPAADPTLDKAVEQLKSK